MWDEDERRITDGKVVKWRDPRNAEIYGSGLGPFFVVMTKEETVAPLCTCGRRGGSFLHGKHSPLCELRIEEITSTFITVQMSGRLRSFHGELFEVFSAPWRK